MRSRAEWLLRAIALVALAMLMERSIRAPREASALTADAHGLHAALAGWSAAATPAVRVSLDRAPAPGDRAWLHALVGAGTRVSWEDAGVPAIAVAAEPLADPARSVRVDVSAPAGSAVAVGDAAGVIDTLHVAAGATGATLLASGVHGAVSANGAATAPVDTLTARPVLVIARAGWEGKFVSAALEEAGWSVSTRFEVAPNATVDQSLAPLDLQHYAAVVALDSAAAPYASRITTFVRSGGGAVIAGEAASLGGLRDILPGAAASRVGAAVGGLNGPTPALGFGLYAIVHLKVDAVVLGHRGSLVTAAARTANAGRVTQVGYDDTWRWRMMTSDSGVVQHRRWWSNAVASVAPTAVRPRDFAATPTALDSIGDPAPRAALFDALGDPAPRVASVATTAAATIPDWILALLAISALLAEWASRRMRGAR